MSSHPLYLVTLGGAVGAIVNDENWHGVENSVRWARSVPVQEVRDFMAQLPGKPIPPDGEQIIDRYVITRQDAEHMDIVVPIHLQDSDQIWALGIQLDARPVTKPGQEPRWLWGLGEQRLLSTDDLAHLQAP